MWWWLLACSVDEERFPAEMAAVVCPQVKRCEKGMYEHEYDAEMKTCLDEVEDYVDDLLFLFDSFSCEWDGDAARECIGDIASMDCAEFHEFDLDSSCEEIYGECL